MLRSSIFAFVALAFATQMTQAATTKEVNAAIESKNYATAREQLGELRLSFWDLRDGFWVAQSYADLIDLLEALDSFDSASREYLDSHAAGDLAMTNYHYQRIPDFSKKYSQMGGGNRVTWQRLNDRLSAMSARMELVRATERQQKRGAATGTSDVDAAIRGGDYQSAYAAARRLRAQIDPLNGTRDEYRTADGYRDVLVVWSVIELGNSAANNFETKRSDNELEFAEIKLADAQKRLTSEAYFGVSAEMIDITKHRADELSARIDRARVLQKQFHEELAQQQQRAAEQARLDEERADKQAAIERQRERRQQQQLLAEAKAARERADAEAEERKKQCGADFNVLRIGMTVDRVEQCFGHLLLVGQINRADGVVSTYRVRYAYAHVMNGKVVAWDRL